MCHLAKFHQNRSNRYGDLMVFKMAAVRYLGLVKFEIFNGWSGKRPILHQPTKFHKDRSNRCRDIAIFAIFHGGCRHLEFSKIGNFNSRSVVRGQYASSCQISSKSVKRLQRYGDLTVFKMAAVPHLGFVKLEFFNGLCG